MGPANSAEKHGDVSDDDSKASGITKEVGKLVGGDWNHGIFADFPFSWAGIGKCPMTWEYWTSPEKVAI